jgi:hypothetical protein
VGNVSSPQVIADIQHYQGLYYINLGFYYLGIIYIIEIIIIRDYLLWAMWTICFYLIHIVHNWKHFGKVLGAGLQNVDNMDNLDGHFKSLAYNIALKYLYKYVVYIK